MEVRLVSATVKTSAQNFTGDVYMTPIYNGTGPSRMTIATVICPPGEEHWHGAGISTFMSHFAMLETLPDGSDPPPGSNRSRATTTRNQTDARVRLEPLTDQRYQTAHTLFRPSPIAV